MRLGPLLAASSALVLDVPDHGFRILVCLNRISGHGLMGSRVADGDDPTSVRLAAQPHIEVRREQESNRALNRAAFAHSTLGRQALPCRQPFAEYRCHAADSMA